MRLTIHRDICSERRQMQGGPRSIGPPRSADRGSDGGREKRRPLRAAPGGSGAPGRSLTEANPPPSIPCPQRRRHPYDALYRPHRPSKRVSRTAGIHGRRAPGDRRVLRRPGRLGALVFLHPARNPLATRRLGAGPGDRVGGRGGRHPARPSPGGLHGARAGRGVRRHASRGPAA